MSTPNVCHLLYRYSPIWGGAENQAMTLLSQLSRENATHFVVTRRFSRQHQGREGMGTYNVFRVFGAGGDRIGHLSFALSAFFFLWAKRKRFNVLHVHGSVGMGLIGLLIARLLNKKMIIKFSEAKKIDLLSRNWFGPLLLRLLKHTDRIICISGKIHENVMSLGISSKKLVRIPNGVDTDKFFPVGDKGDLRHALGFDCSAYIATFSGRLVRGKGLDILLRSWIMVVKKLPGSLLLILGSDAHQRDGISWEAKQFVQENNLTSHVRFLGAQSNVHTYLKCSDLFVFPARDEAEGLPNSVLEAMACGLPVIASNIRANRSIIEHQKNGLLYPTEDPDKLASAILMLTHDASLGRCLGEHAHKTIREKYAMRTVAAEYTKLYQELISE